MTIIENRLPLLERLELKKGSHQAPNNGVTDACVMEAVAWLSGERWSDSPECASPVLGAFLRSWNDVLPDGDRQQLKRYIPRLVGSAGTPEQEDARAWLAMDWLVRSYTPVWLRAAKLNDQATLLEGLPEFRAGIDVPFVRPTITAVRQDAAATRAATRDAAWAVAGPIAGPATRAAAGLAAWDAAWTVAGAAVRAAVRAAAWAAAWTAAGDAARAVAWAAARDAAEAALRPHVVTLQESAHGLVDRMLKVTEEGQEG